MMMQPTPPPLFCQPSCLSTESYGLLLLLISAMLYSVMGLFVKLASNTGIPSTELVFMRAIFQGSLVVGGMIWFRIDNENDNDNNDEESLITTTSERNKQQIQQQNRPRLITQPFGNTVSRNVVLARGALGGIGFVLYFYTISALPLGDAIALISLHPIVTILAAAIFLGETIRVGHVMACLCSVLGSILIAQPTILFGSSQNTMDDDTNHNDTTSSLGYITALLGTFAASGVIVLIRKSGKVGAHTLQLLWSWAFFGTSFSSVLGMWNQNRDSAWTWPSSSTAWLYVLALCMLGSVGHFCMNFAGKFARAGLASIVRSSDIMFAYVWQIMILKQIPGLTTLIGVFFICISLIIVAAEQAMDYPKSADSADQTMEVDENDELFPINQRSTVKATKYGTD